MANRIDCIEKEDRDDPTSSIQTVGGINANGGRWKYSQKEVIVMINSGKYEFFVQEGLRSTKVVVATSRFGNEYIKTEADDYEPNNLLSLKSCRFAA